MADPLSLAASVAGLLSLGIQVTQGISTYIDALKGRQEDLDAVRRKNDALRHIIDSVKLTASSSQPLSRSHAAVADCLATCEDELASLETLVAQLAGCKNAQTWKARLQNKSRKLSYPFKQSKVQQLSQRLDQANGTLQIALEGLGIHIAQRSEKTLEGVATSIHGFSAEFHSVRSEVASIRQFSEESNTLQRDHYDRVENHFAMYTTSLSTIVSTTQNHNTALIAQNSELIAEIGNLRKLVASQERGLSSQASSRVTPAQAVFRVARSPPSQLRKLCDDLGGRESISLASSATDNLVCLCTGRGRRAKRGSTHWGFLQLYHEQSPGAHESHCPWYKKSQKFGFGFFGLTKVLQVAIDVSFTLNTGAGGWSLSQSFTYCPTVDRDTDPIFRALNNFIRGRPSGIIASMQKDYECEVLELLEEIKQIYTEGRSTPNAVDSLNNTPLHHLFLGQAITAFRVRSWEVIYKGLRSLEVPTTSYNLAGRAWLSNLPKFAWSCESDHQSTLALSTIIQSDFAGIPVNPEPLATWDVPIFLNLLDLSPILAEVCNCGPMSLAVLANDPGEVEHILRNHPNSVLERNSMGQTPLHLAADKPSCLQLLVGASTPSLLNQRDGEGMTPLEYAMLMSRSRCVDDHYDARDKCSRCDCAKCVAILLHADCEVPFDSPSHYRTFHSASERARRRFVSHFRNRRQRLFQLAQSHRSVIDKGNLSLGADELPDAAAPLIIDLLRARNIIIPPGLDMSTPKAMFRPIFHVLADASSADLFFQRGFKDIDFPVNGLTPLATQWGDAGYTRWLVDNGADFCRLVAPSRQPPDSTETRGTFAAHSALYQTGTMVARNTHYFSIDADWVDDFSNVILRVLPLSLQDGCNCACSEDGCTPLVYLLKGIQYVHDGYYLQPRLEIFEDSAEFILQYFEPLEDALNIRLQLLSIRWITFEALGFTHACCNPKEVLWFRNSPTCIETDDLSLGGEDPEVLEMFEMMVEELQAAAQSTYAATSSLVDFWIGIWAPRVKKEMEELRGSNLEEKEREGSEAIGVRWHHQPQTEERTTCVVGENPYRWGTLESVQWKYRQFRPDGFMYYLPIKPRASAFQSGQDELSECSS